MTSDNKGGPRREGRPTTELHLAESIDQAPHEDEPGFFALAMMGKVRPAPREPETTCYRSCPA